MQFDMVFEGGGAKGMVFVGAMQEFETRGHTHGRLLGTSAGAITAALLAAGYTTAEMLDALAEKIDDKSVFTEFMGLPGPLEPEILQGGALSRLFSEIDLPIIPDALEKKVDAAILTWMSNHSVGRHLASFIERGGWFSADAFLTWLSDKMDAGEFRGRQRAFSKTTLSEFYAATQKDLSLVVADSTAGMKLVLNHRTAPGVPVVWAVRMSMSIPLLWQEVIWQPGWGKYRDREISGHAIVDGGLLSNFPIELFISDQKPVTDVMGLKVSEHVLGMLIDESISVPDAPPPAQPAHKKDDKGIRVNELSTVQRVMNLVNTMLEARDKEVIATFENLVVRLPAGGYGTTEFDMSDERRTALVNAGRKAMKLYLDKMESAAVSFAFEEAPTPQEIANQIAARMLS